MKKTLTTTMNRSNANVHRSNVPYGYARTDFSRAEGSNLQGGGSAVEIVRGHRFAMEAAQGIGAEAPGRRLRTHAARGARWIISLRGLLLLLMAALTAGTTAVLTFCNFRHATVYGNTKYSEEQIESYITHGTLGENTVVMALKYHNRKVEDIPFVDRIDIDIVDRSTVRVNIREKQLAGVIVKSEETET